MNLPMFKWHQAAARKRLFLPLTMIGAPRLTSCPPEVKKAIAKILRAAQRLWELREKGRQSKKAKSPEKSPKVRCRNPYPALM